MKEKYTAPEAEIIIFEKADGLHTGEDVGADTGYDYLSEND